MRKENYLLNEMVANNFEENSSTFAALIDGYCRRKNTEQAFQLYKKMARNRQYPNTDVFRALITLFCEDGDMQEAV